MTKKVDDQRRQPEFFFVFNSTTEKNRSETSFEQDANGYCQNFLSADVAQTHRDKLLAELREYGC